MTEKQREIIEELGWQIHECNFAGGKKGYELRQHSPAGEDFCFSVEAETEEELAESVRSYAAGFDPEEHVEMWAVAKYNGKDSTIPSIKELVEDADAIDKMLQELAIALTDEELGVVKPEPETADDDVVKVATEMKNIIVDCHKEVRAGYKGSKKDYEVTLAEAYMMMCYGYKMKKGNITAKSVVVFGSIFDIMVYLLNKGIIEGLREEEK